VVAHLTSSAAAPLEGLPSWATLVRAPNPGPMTLDGTNTWVLRAPGAPSGIVVDPGPLDEGHLQAVAGTAPVGGILVTHGHPDHTEGLPRFTELTGAPVGEVTEQAGLKIETIATPGHTVDSVCFVVSYPDGSEPAILTGDTILGRGTTVVAWPDGDLGDYLASLRLLAVLGAVPVLPGHGPALADLSAAAQHYLAHREARLDQVREAIAAGDRTPEEVVARVYADVDRSLWTAAGWSVQAQMEFLRRESHAPPEELDEQ
jgi:glyoxylase-like metal-dependent hydrolase (beta-lactamase superfamily II)